MTKRVISCSPDNSRKTYLDARWRLHLAYRTVRLPGRSRSPEVEMPEAEQASLVRD